MSTARTTISMGDALYEKAVLRQHQLGYTAFSDYIQALIRSDTIQGGAHLREETNPPALPPEPGPSTYRKATKEETRRKIQERIKRRVQQTPSSGPKNNE